MSRVAIGWATGAAASALGHLALAWAVYDATLPSPPPPPEAVETRVSVTALQVPESRADATEAAGDATETAEADGDRIGVEAVRTERAMPVAPDTASLQAQTASGPRASATEPRADQIATDAPIGQNLAAASAVTSKAEAVPGGASRIVEGAMETVAATATPVTSDRVGETTATTLSLSAQAATGAAAPAKTAKAESARVAAVSPFASAAKPVKAGETLLAASKPAAEIKRGTAAPTQSIGVGAIVSEKAAAAEPSLQQVEAGTPVTGIEKASDAAGAKVSAQVAAGPKTAAATAQSDPVSAAAAPAQQAPPRPPGTMAQGVGEADLGGASVSMTASLAWSGGKDSLLDGKSLAAIQSFMAPGETTDSAAFGGSPKDQIGAALSSIPCSRLQAVFHPDTGGLQIRGHVPDPALRSEVVERLSASVGGAIPIDGSLHILPEPQCGILAMVERLGLRQSDDQADDPLTVGQAAQADIFSFVEGDPIFFPSLQAPEYDAWIYLDYFDSSGNVLHLTPSDYVPATRRTADSLFQIGEEVDLYVVPPFGQDIALVIGASEPLYDGLRPIVEPAAPYLAWLAGRVREARRSPDFKGEWVYLFVETGPKTGPATQ